MKRQITLAVAAFMTVSNLYVTAYGANFSDINNAPWEGAKTYINSVADLGLMVGDIDPNNGQKRFRSRDKVTYCETTQLAYTILKNTNNLKASTSSNLVSKWNQVMSSNNIPTWAYESVAYALESNIISLYDVSRFMTKNGSSVSDNYASRESVAVIFGKALSHKYPVNATAVLSYGDASSISSTSVPYVDLLSRLGILVGDTDNNFTPKTYINRAEMAVLVSKTYNVVSGSTGTTPTPTPTPNPTPTTGTDVDGTVLTLEDYGGNKMLTILTSTGQRMGFMINSSTYAIDATTTENKQIDALSLTVGDGVKITYSGSVISVLRLTYDANPGTATTTVKGRIDDITNEKLYLNKSTGGSDFYYYADKYSIKLDGDTVYLKDLFDAFDEGSVDVELALDYSSKITEIKATTISSADIKGTLKAIDKKEISVKKSSSSTKDYAWADDPTVKFKNKNISISNLIKEFDDDSQTIHVEVYLDSRDKVKKLLATLDDDDDDDDDIVTGTYVDLTRDEVEIKTGSKKKTYDLADDIRYKLEGKTASRKDIVDEYDDEGKLYLELTLDKHGDVELLRASVDDEFDNSSSSSKTKKTGTIVEVKSSELRLELKNGDKTWYEFSDDVTYKLNGKSSSRSKIRDEVEDDYEVTATIYLNSRKEITKVEADSDGSSSSSGSKSGEIKNLSRSSISVKTSSNSYDLASGCKVSIDDENNLGVSELINAYGDSRKLEAKLTLKHDIVTAIEAYTTSVEGEITDYSTSKDKIYIKTRDKNELTFKVDDDVRIKINGDTEDEDYLEKKVKDYKYDAVLTLEDSVVTRIEAER